MEEQEDDLGEQTGEIQELAQAGDEGHDDEHESINTVIVHWRHGALAIPQADGEALQVRSGPDDQSEDVVAGTLDRRERDVVVGDGGVLREKIEFQYMSD